MRFNTPPPGWSTPAPNATDTPIPGAFGWHATVHDRIVLTGGGTQAAPIALVAATMPPQPLYTPPAAETSGNYRLMTIDPLTEAPCVLAWNSVRASKRLPQSVVDEWSLEKNSHAIAWVGFRPAGAGERVFITSGGVYNSGGANCAHDTIGAAWSDQALQPWLTNRQTLWFGAEYIPYSTQHSGYGTGEFPIDPRVANDPNNLVWP